MNRKEKKRAKERKRMKCERWRRKKREAKTKGNFEKARGF
jgi:hypothetical protein